MNTILSKLQILILQGLLFILPLFFLTTTQEFYSTNKFYLLVFTVLVLIILSGIRLFQNKKISFSWVNSDKYLLATILLITASVLLASPNKIQALLNPSFGLGMFTALTLFYFFLVNQKVKPLSILFASATLVAIITIIVFVNPLSAMSMPQQFQFLTFKNFTPLGTQLNLTLFMGYFAVVATVNLATGIVSKKKSLSRINILSVLMSFIIIIAFVLSLYNVLNVTSIQISTNPNRQEKTMPKQEVGAIQFAPFSISWSGAVETLKKPKSALFGAGVDNYISVFTQVKPASYNRSSIWQKNFNQGRSFLLHMWTETGIITIGLFLLLLFSLLKSLKRKKHSIEFDMEHSLHAESNHEFSVLFIGLLYLIVIFVFFPPSLIILFLFFSHFAHISLQNGQKQKINYNISSIPLLYGGLALLIITLGTTLFYFSGRAYAAEYSFKKSLSALVANNGQEAYKTQRRAIILNPYIERFRVNFSQLNLLIANNLAGKKTPTDQDRKVIAQAIQTAIAESKAALILNPLKSSNWISLATTYRNIINVAQSADTWTISAYQRALLLDPQNPIIRLNLGGVYYGLGNYKQAISQFEQGIRRKPDMANLHYNLAWAYFKNGRYKEAVFALQNSINLLKDVKSDDYKKAQKDMEDFKKKVPKSTEGKEEKLQPENLAIPTPPAKIDPLIKLPETFGTPEATPEAQ